MSEDQPTRLPTAGAHVPVAAQGFQGLRAGIVSRVIANIVDVIVITLVALSGYMGIATVEFMLDPKSFSFPPLILSRLIIACGILLFVYFTVSWAVTGRTAGDRLMGLRVVNHRGLLMRWSGATMRAAFCVALPIGLFWAMISHQNRSIQDVVLRSSVIYDWGPARVHLGHEPAQHALRESDE